MNIMGMSGLQNSVRFKKIALPNLSPRDYRIVQGLDSAAALVTSQGVVAAAAEERFSREKGTGAFLSCAIQYCLQAGGVSLGEIGLCRPRPAVAGVDAGASQRYLAVLKRERGLGRAFRREANM